MCADFHGAEIRDPERENGMPYPLMRAIRHLAFDTNCKVILEEDGKRLGVDTWQDAVKITLVGVAPIRRATKLTEAVGRKLTKWVGKIIAEMADWSDERI